MSNSERTTAYFAFAFLAIFGVCVAALVLYRVVLRDRWWDENRQMVDDKLTKAEGLVRDENRVGAVAEYRTLLSSVGNHLPESADKKQRLETAREYVNRFEEHERARMEAERARIEQIRMAAEAAARTDPSRVADSGARELFIRARQEYKKYGWDTRILDKTIAAQIEFESDHSNTNLRIADNLLVSFEMEWKENRRSVGLPPDKLD